MTRSVRGTALAALTFLAACGMYGCSTPDFPPGQAFTYNGNDWRVADDRGGRLEITAVDPKLTGMGTIADKRHKVDAMPQSEYRAAVMGWFATTGRFCTPDDGAAADAGGYQYAYHCWLPA